MRYFLIFALYESDEHHFYPDSFIIERHSFPSGYNLFTVAKTKQSTRCIGITGVTELSEEDVKNYEN